MATYPNPDLHVGPDNKQRWNRAQHRRHGFHNAHTLFRRAYMVRSRSVLALSPSPLPAPDLDALCANPAFSALVCLRGDQVIYERHAPDFATNRPHSIQSISKMHIHLIVGRLVARGLLDLTLPVSHYLPQIGSGYASAPLQNLLDMNLTNDFSEDYSDPLSDCYTEEAALGWRLPAEGKNEPTLHEFAQGLTGDNLTNTTGHAAYKSANTDVLTLLCDAISPVPLIEEIAAITDAVGYESALHISLSPEGLPAFSGGGCLSARDLARFGLLFARGGTDIHGTPFANTDFLTHSTSRAAPPLTPPKEWLHYSNHLMTDGRFMGHAGYGGQFLMVDTKLGLSCAYLSVLENEAGYDDAYMANMINTLRHFCLSVETA
jgi:CubicO group peptidase (beta-lactamase class C family)